MLSVLISAQAIAQTHEHQHPPQDATLHWDFYIKWKRIDRTEFPTIVGCCDSKDCYPTKARFENGQWWALRREGNKWIPIPASKVDYGAAPDGRAHLCSPYEGSPHNIGDFIWCFTPPEGGT